MEREFPPESSEHNRHTFRNEQYEVDVYKLIDVTQGTPTEEINTAELSAELSKPTWDDSEGRKITPNDVIEAIRGAGGYNAAKEAYPALAEHMNKIEQADASHAIILHNREVLDGVHRLAKVALNGGTTIASKVLTNIPPEAITQEFSNPEK